MRTEELVKMKKKVFSVCVLRGTRVKLVAVIYTLDTMKLATILNFIIFFR